MTQTDLIIIGAGPGGYETALEAAQCGLQVVLIDKHKVGGTCLNEGCIPTKCLCHTAETLHTIKNCIADGISFDGDARLDLSQAVARKNQIVEQLGNDITMQLKKAGVTYVHGTARLTSANTVAVVLDDGSEQSFEAKDIIIACGSKTAFLPIEGAHLPKVLTSTEMLNLDSIPERICIIGGGVIGLEFASIFNTFGSQITVVEFCKEVLPFFDKDIAKRLRLALKKSGIDFRLSSQVVAIHDKGGCYEVEYVANDNHETVECDYVLMAVGRKANLEALNLADYNIEVSRRGIVVDEYYQTTVPHIYAIGDINGQMQLAHAATFQGKTALAKILGKSSPIQHSLCPAVVFTHPEVAMVGKTEEQLKEEGIEFATRKCQYGANGRALSMGAAEGLLKMYVSADGHILGVHILGSHAAELIHEATAWMSTNATIEQVRQTIHAHPTLNELFINA